MNMTYFKLNYDPNKLWSTDFFYRFQKSTPMVFRISTNDRGSNENPPLNFLLK